MKIFYLIHIRFWNHLTETFPMVPITKCLLKKKNIACEYNCYLEPWTLSMSQDMDCTSCDMNTPYHTHSVTNITMPLFVCFDALRPSQQFFSHVRMIPCLHGLQWPGKACAMRHSPIKNGNVTSFFAMDAPRSLSDFYDHFVYKIGEYEIGEYEQINTDAVIHAFHLQ